jgi:hypothetical protein
MSTLVQWGVRYNDRSTGNPMRGFMPTKAKAISHAARLRTLGHKNVEATKHGNGQILVIG